MSLQACKVKLGAMSRGSGVRRVVLNSRYLLHFVTAKREAKNCHKKREQVLKTCSPNLLSLIKAKSWWICSTNSIIDLPMIHVTG